MHSTLVWYLLPEPDMFANQAVDRVGKLSLYVAGVCIVLGVVPALFCKE